MLLKGNIYNKLKKRGLNDFFKKSHSASDLRFCELKNKNIKKSFDFDLIKEDLLKTYILAFKNVIIIHLEENEYRDFLYLYKNSELYTFDIYSTINYKNVVIYHIFCTNKYLDEKKDYHDFLNGNECEYKYQCLTKIYGPCLIVNRRYNLLEFQEKLNSKYLFVKTIGKGVFNPKIKFLLNQMIIIINKYYINYLPVNYLNV